MLLVVQKENKIVRIDCFPFDYLSHCRTVCVHANDPNNKQLSTKHPQEISYFTSWYVPQSSESFSRSVRTYSNSNIIFFLSSDFSTSSRGIISHLCYVSFLFEMLGISSSSLFFLVSGANVKPLTSIWFDFEWCNDHAHHWTLSAWIWIDQNRRTQKKERDEETATAEAS